MSEPWAVIFTVAVGAWIGALVTGIVALRVLFARLGRDDAWPAARQLAPAVDLVGTWAGTIGVVALALGRVAFSFSWAAPLGLLAVMLTFCLYDRAVLMPSLDAAWKRTVHDEKWEKDWRFLWRMAHGGRWSTLAMGIAALIVA